MQPSSADEFEQALRECAAEPIHQIGKVQPHAGLLVLQPDGDRKVLQVSDNIAAFVGRPAAAVLGQGIAAVLDAPAVAIVDAMVARAHVNGRPATGRLRALLDGASVPLIAHLYPSD